MANPTNYFVDPSLTSDTGDGTITTPWGRATAGTVIQYALDTGITSRDATNGDCINIKAGTAEVLAATLSTGTYGNSSSAAPLCFQGYTSAQGDGGVGEIDGDGGRVMWQGSQDGVRFIDLKMGNSGSAGIFDLDNQIWFIRCEIHTSSNALAINADVDFYMIGCYLHGLGAGQIVCRNGVITDNVFDHGTNTGDVIEVEGGDNGVIQRNLFLLNTTGAARAIYYASTGFRGVVGGNSIYNAAAGTGQGIYFTEGNYPALVANNLIEGFSGVGGIGIRLDGNVETMAVVGNGFYGNTTNISGSAAHLEEDNEALGATPFASKVTFQPADTGNVLEGAYPTTDVGAAITYSRDKGAVQLTPTGGGSGGGLKIAGNGGLAG